MTPPDKRLLVAAGTAGTIPPFDADTTGPHPNGFASGRAIVGAGPVNATLTKGDFRWAGVTQFGGITCGSNYAGRFGSGSV